MGRGVVRLPSVPASYPIVGFRLSPGLACVALSWMLRASLLGATLTAMHPVLHGCEVLANCAYWTQSY